MRGGRIRDKTGRTPRPGRGRFASTADAPRTTASVAKSWPSRDEPTSATKRSPGRQRRESLVQLCTRMSSAPSNCDSGSNSRRLTPRTVLARLSMTYGLHAGSRGIISGYRSPTGIVQGHPGAHTNFDSRNDASFAASSGVQQASCANLANRSSIRGGDFPKFQVRVKVGPAAFSAIGWGGQVR